MVFLNHSERPNAVFSWALNRQTFPRESEEPGSDCMPERAALTHPEHPTADSGSVSWRPPARESLAIVFLAMAFFLVLCLVSYDPRDPSFNVATTRPEISNLCGLVGSYIADTLVQLLGLGSFVVAVGLIVLAVRAFVPPRSTIRWTEVASVGTFLAGASALLERFAVDSFSNFSPGHAGGALGRALHDIFFRLLGSAGEILISGTLILLCLLHLSKVSLRDGLEAARSASSLPLAALPQLLMAVKQWWSQLEPWTIGQDCKASLPASQKSPARVSPVRVSPRMDQVAARSTPATSSAFEGDLPDVHSWERISFLPRHDDATVSASGDELGCVPAKSASRKESLADLDSARSEPVCWRPVEKADNTGSHSIPPTSTEDLERAIEAYLEEELPPGRNKRAASAEESVKEEGQPRPIKVTKRADEEISRTQASKQRIDSQDDYRLPPVDLLDMPEAANRVIDERILEANAMVVEQKLADLGIRGEVVEVHPGPVITMYELVLAPGIPLRKILNTSDDLAMALKSGSTRVVAPIPGKDTVGIEVPNINREIVYFREIIESPAFVTSNAPLKIALGKCIDGQPFASSLSKMPHLLIAGATGTGKSVGLNCLICSWLMSCHPDDLKLIMVDPKKLELSYYQDIPHLLHPVVTDPEKVPKVLSWAIREMERRYDLLSLAGAKNIESYNHKVLAGEIPDDPDGNAAEKLPYVIIIVDELAELMMVAAKDIEISIARLAQMARAAGIHLILATQRPSVDVITGIIKANFPARISFQVSAKPDSRTILDTTGAENLLGMGDMLFLPPGAAKLLRLHGAFVSEEDIRRVVDFIKAQRSPIYLKEIAKHMSEGEAKASAGDLILDEKYDEAVELVTGLGHASISLIQRHMRIGYNRAARIIEAMEADGIIGPSDGTSRPREVLARSLGSIPDSL
jgi:DNA segregation ATPase FtsK/SpoIIIE-like protein